jgi:hypothetical protein
MLSFTAYQDMACGKLAPKWGLELPKSIIVGTNKSNCQSDALFLIALAVALSLSYTPSTLYLTKPTRNSERWSLSPQT